MIRERIEEAVRAAVGDQVPFVVERPRSLEHGDYATNAALVAKLDPNELAGKLKIEGVEQIKVVGKFINLYLSRAELVPKEEKIPQLNAGKTIMVEYTDPNPFKEFHIGHLMSNSIGEAIAHLLERTGAKVLRANYQGDVGPHVAKAIWGKMQKPEFEWGKAYTYGSTEYETHKAEIDAINKKVYERSDAAINALYDAGRKESLEHFEKLYKALGTKFDYYFFESETGPKGLKLVQSHPEVFEQSEGATVFHGEHTRVFITSQGLPTYEAKDLGLLQLKKEKTKIDGSITVTANEQNDYFKVVLAAARKLLEVADIAQKTTHLSHGMMRFASGKMSSRTGNVITGESLLEDLTKVARGREDVAAGAIKYAVLKQNSGKDIIFDPEKSLSLEGDSGPYLQYAHVRATSLLRKAKEARAEEVMDAQFVTPQVKTLERILVHYPEVVERAADKFEPHYLTTFLAELASAFNSWYAAERAIVDGVISGYTLRLIQAVERTLREGLETLGIPVPEEM
jgi:arginyl-tRNA synthetase